MGEPMTERMISIDGIELCTDSFGDPRNPAVLLIMGIGASMLWWDEELCRALAAGDRFVIRYDHRDTGRSVVYEPGQPAYTGADLAADARRVLDGRGVGPAHVVGVSAGGAFAQVLALTAPERVLSLTLISTTPATPADRPLPPPTAEFGRFVAQSTVDWSDRASIVEHLVRYCRVLAGGVRPFDEAAARKLIQTDITRARNPASLQNHELLGGDDERAPRAPLSAVTAPTLVIHGTADPLFPPQHGEALAAEIPNARLLLLDGAGHGIAPADHETLSRAIHEHTAAA
jgi:pimeloyl-ACP methyl ester carboxylesterase